MEERPIEKKRANALKPEARARFEDKSEMVESFGDLLRSIFGGLWVGGTAELYETRLVFRPNAANRAAHADDTSTEVLLDSVTDVQLRGGFITKIIDVATEDGGLTIRCFGAEGFAERIRTQVEQQSSPPGIA